MNASMKPSPTLTNPSLTLEALRTRLKRLNLYGLLAQAEQLLQEPWLTRMLEIEEGERQHRSLKRRLANARLLKYKSMADFDYQWPKKLDRELLDELFTLDFLEQATNVILVGPNAVAKTMIAKNLLHQAILRGHTARFVLASDMLHDLAAQDSSTQLARRLRRYTSVGLLCIDLCAVSIYVEYAEATVIYVRYRSAVLHITIIAGVATR